MYVPTHSVRKSNTGVGMGINTGKGGGLVPVVTSNSYEVYVPEQWMIIWEVRTVSEKGRTFSKKITVNCSESVWNDKDLPETPWSKYKYGVE
ncbi:hypothetical protein FACS1894110_10080 [Spirochaetia bacterium]|nr:hypothetical protein FACS1894110_10080 [Spirochaetia bacterium]